jgi:hypothetical protein
MASYSSSVGLTSSLAAIFANDILFGITENEQPTIHANKGDLSKHYGDETYHTLDYTTCSALP